MDINLRSRNGTRISERQRSHIEEKLNKLQRYVEGIRDVNVEVSEQQLRGEGEVFRVQVTLVIENGTILRAEKTSSELYAAVDLVEESLHRQLTRFKDRHWRRGKLRHRGGEVIAVDSDGAPAEVGDAIPNLIRTKNFNLKPMYSDEAIEQMELLGHDFFVFRDVETQDVNVVYRRRDGNYGLIVPDGV